MKTAEEVLKKRIPVNGFITNTGDADYSRDECISAMIEYAAQFKPNEQQGGVVRPEVECAKAGEMLPAEGAELTVCDGIRR